MVPGNITKIKVVKKNINNDIDFTIDRYAVLPFNKNIQ
jgi:hypothetical protein